MNRQKHELYFSALMGMFCLILFCSSVTMAATAEETIKKNIAFEPGGYLSLSNMNGTVDIYAWDKNEIEIIAHKKVTTSGPEEPEELLKALEVDIQEENGKVIIETHYPRGRSGGSFFNWLFKGNKHSMSVEYEIKVPRQIDLNIQTTNGGVNVEEIEGRVRIESTNGKIVVRSLDGVARCKTTNGSIKVDFNTLLNDEVLSFKTTNGSIKLYLPSDFSAEVDLKTTNGRINSDFPLEGQSRSSKRKFRGLIKEGVNTLKCTTTNGNIDLIRNN